ncbi:hypothetical protein [Ohtaekwangia sp.]|uniref:hypothetical protein n=1 Tax=Ohtaekwangia sp. TaxID=2066019 RepID=UPI002F95E1A2
MADEYGTLKIKAERLGAVSEVKNFLTDLESAYNNIYVFDFFVDSLNNDRNRQRDMFEERLSIVSKYWTRTDFPFDPIYFDIFSREYRYGFHSALPNLTEFQSKVDFDRLIIPEDKLVLSKVNIQSPGFWEVIGSWNPLQQVREYIKDRHERQKDGKYRNRQEEKLGELAIMEKQNTIVQQRIETLKSLGYSDTEIRQFVTSMVTTPLGRLDKHQDNGQIEGIEE